MAINETLTASITDSNGFDVVSYQWQSDGEDIPGATQATYQITLEQANTQVRVAATYTDNDGFDESLFSEYTATITPPNIPGTLNINGILLVGETLSASVDDGNGTHAVNYQWYAGASMIANATSSRLTLTRQQLGIPISVRATYIDDAGYQEALESEPTEPVIEYIPNGSVTIEGEFRSGETVTAVITDPDNAGTAMYDWFLEGQLINNQHGAELTLADDYAGKVIQVRATYTDENDNAESPTSLPSPIIAERNFNGSLTINGEAFVGSRLSAIVADENGFGVVSYQWFLDEEAILNANASQLNVLLNYVGQAISVNVSYRDGSGFEESLNSAATAFVQVRNIQGSVSISGDTAIGGLLSAVIDDGNGLTIAEYQWFLDGIEIVDAIQNSYTVLAADAGKSLSVSAAYIDHAGYEENHTSNTLSIPLVNYSGELLITGTTLVTETLSANLADDNGFGNVQYQWYDEGILIPGAIEQTYTLRQSNAGHAIQARATYTDNDGFSERITSTPTAAIEQINYPGSLSISGDLIVEGELSLVLEDDNGFDTVAYQWLANGVNIDGATDSTYTLLESDKGDVISVTANYTDSHNFTESLTAEASDFVAPLNYPGTISVSGTERAGKMLTAVVTDNNGTSDINYRWLADGEAIDGAVAASYLLTDSEVGKVMTITASYTDNDNFEENLTSIESEIIDPAPINSPGVLTIAGDALLGSTLQANLIDGNGFGQVAYQWLADGTNITGATNTSLLLGDSQRNKVITVVATYQDDDEFDEVVTSAATEAVIVVNIVGSVLLSGKPVSQQTLTATVSDGNGTGAINYVWLSSGATISGATSQTYVLQDAQIDEVITVQVTYTDNDGYDEAHTSNASETIKPVPTNSAGVLSVAGSPTLGSALVATVTDENIVSNTIIYEWLADDVVISGETNNTLSLAEDFLGKHISVNATYQDDDFFDESLSAEPGVIVTTLASNGATLVTAIDDAAVGDWIGLDGGATDYANLNISIDKAITITNIEGSLAEITGAMCIEVADGNDDGAVLTGLTFSSIDWISGGNCDTNKNASILLEGDNTVFSHNSLLSQAVITNSANSEHNWLVVRGRDSTIERNLFVGKRGNYKGGFISLASASDTGDKTGHILQYNLFKDFIRNSDGETATGFAYALQVGQSTGTDANHDTNFIVRYNRFDNIITKERLMRLSSTKIIIDSNTIVNSTGAISLEDGFDNTVSNNIIIASGTADPDEDGAIRLNRFGHTISNNYIAGVTTDNSNLGAIVLTNTDETEGISNAADNGGNAELIADTTTDFTVTIENNSIINTRQPFVFNDCIDPANFKADFSQNLVASGENPTTDDGDNFGLEGKTIGESGSGFGAVVVNCNILTSTSTHNNEHYFSDALSTGDVGGFSFSTGQNNIGASNTAGDADITAAIDGLFEGTGNENGIGVDTSKLVLIEESDVGPRSTTVFGQTQ